MFVKKFFVHNSFFFEEHFLNVKLIENINSSKIGPFFPPKNQVDHVRVCVRRNRDKIKLKKNFYLALGFSCFVTFVLCATFLPTKST